MSDLELTNEEREYVERLAHQDYSATWRLGFYAAFGLPLLAFGLCGLVQRDFVAEFIAFAGLFLFLCWRVSYEFGRLGVYKSVFRKIANHEKRSGGV